MFEQARYEINVIEIDRNKNVGLTSLMKYIEMNYNEQSLTNATGFFDVSVPLCMIFGLAEDYHKIIVNAKHELILTTSKSDANAILQAAPIER